MRISSLNDQRVAPLVPNVEPPLHAPHRPSGFKDDHLASDGPSIGGRIVRAAGRYLLAMLIGVGVTLTWQAYGDEGKQLLRARVPSLGGLLPISTKSPSDSMASTQSPIVSQSTPVTQSETTAALTSRELVQQLDPVVRDLVVVRQSLEQLAAKQDQIAQSMVMLQAAEQDLRQKMSSPPAPRPAPPRKPPPPAAHSSAAQSASVPSPPPSAQPPSPQR
jgi:hypothetical protein